jgi:hypothetical protein
MLVRAVMVFCAQWLADDFVQRARVSANACDAFVSVRERVRRVGVDLRPRLE